MEFEWQYADGKEPRAHEKAMWYFVVTYVRSGKQLSKAFEHYGALQACKGLLMIELSALGIYRGTIEVTRA